jgi:WD40 repeat protein
VPPGFWPPGNVTCRAYSPDGRTTALATDHGSVLIFDANLQQKKATLHGRAHSIFSLAFSPDGRRLLSGSDALWDVETWEELLPLVGDGALHQVAQISDDGNTLLIGSWNRPGETEWWRAPTLQEIADAEKNGGGWPRTPK